MVKAELSEEADTRDLSHHLLETLAVSLVVPRYALLHRSLKICFGTSSVDADVLSQMHQDMS